MKSDDAKKCWCPLTMVSSKPIEHCKGNECMAWTEDLKFVPDYEGYCKLTNIGVKLGR